jgi:hypothetical protein
MTTRVRGDAKVTIVHTSGWYAVVVFYAGSGRQFGYEVASYRRRPAAAVHATIMRRAMACDGRRGLFLALDGLRKRAGRRRAVAKK